ncbi:MAG: threonine--tRNA ligase [Enterobacterales bacterium]
MPVITLTNGNKHFFAQPISVLDFVNKIYLKSNQLCIAARINGKLVDIDSLIIKDSNVDLVFNTDSDGLKIIRNSCIYLLGRSIKQLWPNSKMILGGIIDQSFYYKIDLDFYLTKNDLCLIEKKMHSLIHEKYNIIYSLVKYDEAYNFFLDKNESYKIDYLNNIESKNNLTLVKYQEYTDIQIHNIPKVYKIEMCKYFKLYKLSKSYIHLNNNKKTSQKIYGTAWYNTDSLNNYVNYLFEIDKRDHRKIGKRLDLYHIQENAPGMVFWHNNGYVIFRELELFIRSKLRDYNYQEVKSPFMIDKNLWEKTGHLDYYADNIFITSSENREYCIKPMNCPGHIQIFNKMKKSYKDLPLRISEFGSCHRNEYSGSLHGLMRIRNFTQDDAHIFCTNEQIFDEVNKCISMIYDIYSVFGFKKILVKLSTCPKKHIGDKKLWENSENNLISVLLKNKISFDFQKGEGAFYGPKIEFILQDSLNRSWQCGTIQVDFSLPKRLSAFYTNEKNEKVTPIIIHRAILGSIERFIGILTEEYKGLYPLWLSPIQVVVLNISHNHKQYVINVNNQLFKENIRVIYDISNETINFKIRKYYLNNIPYIIICGNQEIQNNSITVRLRNNINIKNIKVMDFVKKLKYKINSRDINYTLEE